MPRTKDALSRYRIIDAALRRWRPISSKDLAKRCEERLGISVAERTIQNDIADMKHDTGLLLNAPIRYDTKGKLHYYERGTPPLIFPSVTLSEEETQALLFYTKAASHFKHYRVFNEISQAIQKVLDASNIPHELRNAFTEEGILETDPFLPSRGIEMINTLVQAVHERRMITFQYQRFEDKTPRKRTLKPLLIKEYQDLWYVVGVFGRGRQLFTFAVDRIMNLTVTDKVFDEVEFDAKTHFEYVYGITVSAEAAVDVVLSFTPQQGNYIKAVPLCTHQQVLVDDANELRLNVKIKPSYEFYARLLSYGAEVKVLSPPAVVNEVKRKIGEALQRY